MRLPHPNRTLAQMARRSADEDHGSSRSKLCMADLMRSRDFAPALYSFAWAQAVQNKPLLQPEDVVVRVDSSSDDEDDGELEDGEIELGSEPQPPVDKEPESSQSDNEIGEFDMRVGLILEDLETVTVEETEASLVAVCARLRKSFESLKQMSTESRLPVLDTLVHQAFVGMQTVNNVVRSCAVKKNEELLLKLLIHIKNQYTVLLTDDQSNELDAMVQSLVSTDYKGRNMNGFPSHSSVSSVSDSLKAVLPKFEVPTVARNNRVEFEPSLNLHVDCDECNLPSPTRENAHPLPMQKQIGFGREATMLAQQTLSDSVKIVEPYVPYAKHVSSYQQKYSGTSFHESNRLPSPTPSENADGNDDTHGEVSSSLIVDNARAVNSASSSQLLGSSSSGAYKAGSPDHLGFIAAPYRTAGQLVLGLMTAVNAPGNSKDSRLRIVNPENSGTFFHNRCLMSEENDTPNGFSGGLMNSRKYKAVDEPLLGDHTFKRPRHGLENSNDVQMTSGRSGWSEEGKFPPSQLSGWKWETEIRKPGNRETGSNGVQNANSKFNGINSGIGQNFSTNGAPEVLLPSMLKDVTLNSTMLMQLIQMGCNKSLAQGHQKTVGSVCLPTITPNANILTGAVSAEIGASLKTSTREQNSAGKPHLPAQTVSLNTQSDLGRIRMKSRDPRRILRSNTVRNCESLKVEPAKTIEELNNEDHVTIRDQGEQAQTTSLPSHPVPQPRISLPFTNNIKDLADTMSSLQSANSSIAGAQNASSPIPNKIYNVAAMPAATDFNGKNTVSGWACEGRGAVGASQASNPWGDVDHLLDGYDDQQKASIQRERTRRIEEQKTMFAAGKLCLVLDIDHTLLNSAKFIDVDPIRDEILRKKVGHDREKPQRHLFRFEHMGMWTKLRPGVWKFLERASKLYELHLYTMGNKSYATEIAKLLDPTGALFAGRVIARGDDIDPINGEEIVTKTKDLDGVLGMESAVVIIDDSLRVWPHNKHNLILVERYTYFPCSRRQFGLPGPSLLEIDRDERPEDGTLAASLAVIERIHNNFFSHQSLNDVDVRNILASEQRKILAGCRIVFSRIFPVGETNPHLHPLWQTAEQFGAVCTNHIDDQVTHVVANSRGTDKVNWAQSTGRFVVRPSCMGQEQLPVMTPLMLWVEASSLLYRRANEHNFAIKT